MDYGLNEQQEMVKTSARDFLIAECPKSLVREMAKNDKGYSPELWCKMADVGWMGLAFPDQYGGADCSFLELVVLLDEMGRACLPGPFFSTVVLGGMTILDMGNENQKQELLPKIASGDLIVTLALAEPGARQLTSEIKVKATAEGSDFVISGTKIFVPDAHVADYIICVARTKETSPAEDGVTVFLVDAKSQGLSCTLLKTLSGDKQCEVNFDNVRVSKDNILGELDHGWPGVERMLQMAAIGKCADMVGGAQQVLEMSVSYAKERVQFGHPVGSFQAVQHHCANMITDVDTSRFMTYQVAWRFSEGLSSAMDISMAKAWVSEACQRVSSLGHQINGGVGVVEDHDMPLYSSRAKAAWLDFGDASFHRELIAQEMGL